MPDIASPYLQDFFGTYKCTVEESGRLMVPPKLRLKDPYDTYRIILWPIGADRCLLVFPPWIWSSFIEEMRVKPEAQEKQESWQRAIGRTGDMVTLDKVGRIVIREDLLEKAGITKEAVLIGRISTFEAWSPERLAEFGKDDPQRAFDLADPIMLVKTKASIPTL